MSTTVETSNETLQESSQNTPSVDTLAENLEKTALQSNAEDTQAVAQVPCPGTRPWIVYTRKQLVLLSQSSLVKVPDGMPDIKVWFGEVNEASLLSVKKESDGLTLNGGTRERRYRREVEDGDASTRPAFRSALSQPSQMGNFKHQPLRSTDRDRDTERDLRSLSDRYDRDKATRGDRMGLSSHATLLRTRDRDSAPHLAPDRDAQRTLARKRNGENKEDWRRGAEPLRSGRDDNNPRRERGDGRERQRSRARDTSRTRESPPATRREREEQRKDWDRDRFNEADEDSKRWRDEGKRDEKLNTRRDKDRPGRERDAGPDRNREAGDDRDGWSIADDKKRGARDRRFEDKEDKKEREKEKEPAWMETYVPPVTSTSGILGGKGGDGEIDGIQAWKKEMKEREMKAKGLTSEPSAPSTTSTENALDEMKQSQTPSAQPEGHLDEIQLFKLMMKKAQAGGDGQGISEGRQEISNASLPTIGNGVSGALGTNESQATASNAHHIPSGGAVTSENGLSTSIDPLLASKSGMSFKSSGSTPLAPSPSTLPGVGASSNSSTMSNGPRLLSLKSLEPASLHREAANKDVASSAPPFDPPRTSRLLAFGAQNAKVTAQPSPQSAAAAVQMGRLQQMDPLLPNQRRASVSPVISVSASQQSVFDKASLQQQMLSGGSFDMNTTDNTLRRSALEPIGHNPVLYDNGPRTGNPLDTNREFVNVDLSRSSVPLSASERTAFMPPSDSMYHLAEARRIPTPPTANYGVTSPISPLGDQLTGGQSTYSLGKGSRMAKHFERQRDHSLNPGRNLPNAGLGTNGIASSRQEHLPHSSALASGENRNIQDLLTMLNNSAQAQRGHLNQNLGQHQPPQSIHFGPSNNQLSRHDPLLDSDDGRFAPDGLVPGLRPAVPPAPRNREMSNGSLYANQLDDSLAFQARLGPQQRGGLDQLFANQMPSQFNGLGATGGRSALPIQQQVMRGGPSPTNNFNAVQGLPQQRLPPGLANLGGRPPHEPSQFLGGNTGNFGGVPSQLHAGLQHTGNTQAFNQFQNPGLGMVGNQSHLRGQPGLGQLGNSIGNGLNGIDFRGGPGGPPQNQVLGLGAPNLGQTMRAGSSFNSQQLHGPNQILPSVNMRQQHNLPPQMLQQLLPQHLQGVPPGQHNPNDLMALLMGNPHRE